MNVKVAGIQDCTICDMDGVATIIFMQGCIHACPGCHNPEQQIIYKDDTLDMNIDDIINKIKSNINMLDGVVLSGGDPYFQRKESIELSKQIKKLNLKIWVYTGYLFENIDDEFKEHVDVIIDGKFDINKKGTPKHGYGGSTNQRMFKKINNKWVEINDRNN